MKKFLVVICSMVLAFGLAGCVGKAPVGKGKAPIVQTRGNTIAAWSDFQRDRREAVFLFCHDI